MSQNPFRNKTILVTGHTGFKGSWLSIWLRELGARVMGFSLPDLPTKPCNFQLCGLEQHMLDMRGDLRDFERVCAVLETHRPQVIFHLAAQPLVLEAYQAPRETFNVNAMGTVNLLEAVRTTQGAGGALQAMVCITTDKVYENREWVWGYRETDHLGGHDPYSASKAMAELAIASYRRSFFAEQGIALASARAGNVIGGGDFADNRLLPDCMRALMAGQPIVVRHPDYVRPWQHVLESLSGYLTLAARLLEEGAATHSWAGAWNFAPQEAGGVTAQMVVEKAIELWGSGEWTAAEEQEHEESRQSQEWPKETNTLRLNWDKAANLLGWRPVYTWEEALIATVEWFRWFQKRTPQSEMYDACAAQIAAYVGRGGGMPHLRRLETGD